ncbi:hypothetical protein ACKVMT_05345 [Halobacteriales archaeon Cl-PHB]
MPEDLNQAVGRHPDRQGIRRIRFRKATVRRFIEDFRLPYNPELETTVERFALAEDTYPVAEDLTNRLDRPKMEGLP